MRLRVHSDVTDVAAIRRAQQRVVGLNKPNLDGQICLEVSLVDDFLQSNFRASAVFSTGIAYSHSRCLISWNGNVRCCS